VAEVSSQRLTCYLGQGLLAQGGAGGGGAAGQGEHIFKDKLSLTLYCLVIVNLTARLVEPVSLVGDREGCNARLTQLRGGTRRHVRTQRNWHCLQDGIRR
jgi:hypothetical protein